MEEMKKQEVKNEGIVQVVQKVVVVKVVEKIDFQVVSGKILLVFFFGCFSLFCVVVVKVVVCDVDVVEKEQSVDVDDEIFKEVYGKEYVNIIFIGYVDVGKSIFGGVIFYVIGMVDQRIFDKYKRDVKEMGCEIWYFFWVFDLINEECFKGKIVEVGCGFFEIDKCRYSILDVFGYKIYVFNMIGGVLQVDVGIFVIFVCKGEYEIGFEKGGQIREYVMLVKIQGVNKFIVVINKMDDFIVNWFYECYFECIIKFQ